MNKRWLKLAAVPVALSLVAAACGSDDDSGSDGDTETTDGGSEAGGDADFGGATVTITGPERDDPSIIAINDTLGAWAETVNLTVEYTGDADWEANINTQVEGGNPRQLSDETFNLCEAGVARDRFAQCLKLLISDILAPDC